MDKAEKETADQEKTLQEKELAQLKEMTQPVITTSTPLPQSDDMFKNLTEVSSTSQSDSRGRRNLLKDFAKDDVPSSKESSSSLDSSENDKGYDTWVTRMLREKTKVKSSYIVESNVSARVLTRKRFLEKKQTHSSSPSQREGLELTTSYNNGHSFSSRNATVSSATTYQNDTLNDSSFIDASNLTGSPRLKAFEGRRWIWSERTGYTYTMSPTYRNEWTPEREKLTTPMPHMARLPIHAYNDVEVSFHSPILLSSSASKQLSFSSDEEGEEGDAFLKWKYKSQYGKRQRGDMCRRFINKILTIVKFLLWLLLFPILYPMKLIYQGSKSFSFA